MAIVDDDPGMLISLSNLLDARGFKVHVFASAEDWLDRSASIRADCMLLDVHLSGISGIELQQRLRACGSKLPVIFITAHDDEPTRSQALEAGGVSLLCKPVAAALLIGTIERAVAQA